MWSSAKRVALQSRFDGLVAVVVSQGLTPVLHRHSGAALEEMSCGGVGPSLRDDG